MKEDEALTLPLHPSLQCMLKFPLVKIGCSLILSRKLKSSRYGVEEDVEGFLR